MQLNINKIIIGKRFRKEMGDIQGLADSIKEQGLLQPVGINKQNELIFGLRRIEAVKLLGWEHITAIVVNVTSLIEGELTENEIRKNFTNDEKVAIGEMIEQQLGNRQGQRTDIIIGNRLSDKCHRVKRNNELVGKCPQVKTRDIVAKKVGFGSRRTYEKAKLISEKATPEQKQKIDKNERSINSVYKDIKRIERKHEIENMPEQQLDGKYNVLLIDPPWQYDNNDSSLRGNALDHYSTMSIDEIEKIDIKSITLKDAVLFLWTTSSMIKKAFEIMETWGFEFKTSMVWVKQKMGTGFYVRSKHEIILIGIKGHFLPMTTKLPESVFFANSEKHSKKPEIIYEIIENMYPNQRNIELFARQTRKNWHRWGFESNV